MRPALACLDEFWLDPCADASGSRPGVVFVPFHYGYWDTDADEPNGRPRAANKLTLTAWDPVSKQPIFKTAAVKVKLVREGEGRTPRRRRRPPRPSTPDRQFLAWQAVPNSGR